MKLISATLIAAASLIAIMTLPVFAEGGQVLDVEVTQMEGMSKAGLHFISASGDEEEIITISQGSIASHQRMTTDEYTLKASFSTTELVCAFENGTDTVPAGDTKLLLSLNETACVLDYYPGLSVYLNFFGTVPEGLTLGWMQELSNGETIGELLPFEDGETLKLPVVYDNGVTALYTSIGVATYDDQLGYEVGVCIYLSPDPYMPPSPYIPPHVQQLALTVEELDTDELHHYACIM